MGGFKKPLFIDVRSCRYEFQAFPKQCYKRIGTYLHEKS
jgi:hypothetical protein